MDKYELTLVLPGKATPAKKKAVEELIGKMVKTFKGKVVKVIDWGKISLAYPIEKNDSGNFLHFQLELEKEGPKNISEKLNLEKGIIRHLLVKEK